MKFAKTTKFSRMAKTLHDVGLGHACLSCGKPILAGQKFCRFCGKKI